MVTVQDIRDREVYWFWFPIIGICAGILFYSHTLTEQFLTAVGINLGFVGFLIAVVFLYSKLKLKTSISKTFGLGDGLLFLALGFSFMPVSFIVLFIFGLIFSLVLHFILNHKQKHQTVPLAGYLSLFFALAYLGCWFGLLESVYTI